MGSKCRTVMVALFAASALVTIASASAFAALPEFFPTYKGGNKFTGSGGGATFILEKFGTAECRSSSVTGSIAGPKEISNLVVKFSGCGGEGRSALLCGEAWETKPLTGTLGFVSKANKAAGLLLQPVTSPFAECKTTFKQKILGSVIGSIVQSSEKKLRLTFETNSWLQHLKHFEGEELMHTLEWEYPAGLKQGMGVSYIQELTTEKAFELNV